MPDIDHLRQWIGTTEQATEQLTPAFVDRFNATFDVAGAARAGDIAPLMIHLCLAPPAVPTSALGPDGHPERGGFLPPVPLPRRMWAGGAFEFQGQIKVGETVTRRSEIRDVTLKQGRSGKLCFVTVEHRFTAEGRPALTERQDIVYREAATHAPAPASAPPGQYRESITPSAALLFRYSALTFNGHRIHYDAPYSREVEGYPGLIVHGPLQASLLVRFAARLRGTPPAHFAFRSLSTLFDDADFTLNASDDGAGLRLWTCYENGPVAMEAVATW
ncbi:MAG: MaoC family dehydratase N-terminal domain-containing protein [Paracoccus sp. (in: a-proteobacteria)]|nr:MaoC family dehydratase N-terminal domain-containing protein [Paracoccus sp. (in: a-proteobacteria)]